MNTSNSNMGGLLQGLQERAKELICLYRVEEILHTKESSQSEKLLQIVEAIPQGFQYPDLGEARIVLSGRIYETAGFSEMPWILSAPLTLRSEVVGSLDVVYLEEMAKRDEGPFLEEERKLLNTLAEQISFHLTHEEIIRAWETWESTLNLSEMDRGGKWKVILEFLEQTDPQLLQRISRRMVNHLRWKGVEGIEALFKVRDTNGSTEDENRPLDLRALREIPIPTSRVFQIAAENCSEEEILHTVQAWINKDKISFLINAVEWQESSLSDVTDALERFRVLGMKEEDFPPSVQSVLRVGLLRRFFTEQNGFIHIAKEYVKVLDFHEISRQVIHPPGSFGKLGGKAAGLFLAWKILERSAEEDPQLEGIRVPKTWYIASDAVIAFIRHNNLEDVFDRKYLDIEDVRQRYPYLIQLFKSSPLPPEIRNGLSLALEDFGDRPLIVRSSSLLEDSTGAAFSGKYKSLFLANQGTKEERLQELRDAVAEVYASIFGPDPIEYRAERNLLDVHEEMGILIQEVVGTRVGKYFLPAFSGVAFSNNEFRWSPRIKREDGLVRLVPGLGTRAVDRLSDDFPILLAPGQPGLRVNTTPEEIIRYSPRMLDVINLEARTFESVRLDDFLKECGNELPLLRRIISLVDDGEIRRPGGLRIDFEKQEAVVTFEGLASDTPFVGQIAKMLEVLRHKMAAPVDLEFAFDGTHLHLLQCRPQSFSGVGVPDAIPRDLPKDKILFSAHRYVSNGVVPEITHVVYVDPEEYGQLPDEALLKDVGRAVGRLNNILPRRQFILMGPGRWGSRGDIRLGVSVTYSDINNTAVLIEIARKTGNYVPDLSFGTHFFQDLVEADIRYLPLYPDEPENELNETFLRRGKNLLPELLPEFEHLSDTVRVLEVPAEKEGLVLKILLNADLDEAVGIFAQPGPPPSVQKAKGIGPTPTPVLVEPLQEDHWQWRLRMVESIAAHLDADRFGVKGMWVFGSTKNATAGPGSDVDLLLHFAGTEEKREDLLLWLEGWSLSLAEINYLRTGYSSSGLLDVHLVTDKDIEEKTSYASKIGAVTDAARPLRLMEKG